LSAFLKYPLLSVAIVFLFNGFTVNAQLGFCSGNSGDAIFTEDFGSGLTPGPVLPAGTTTYSFSSGCENTSYEFSSWLNNIAPPPSQSVCPGGNIPINVRFQIWDNTETIKLAEGDTGNIPSMNVATWEQYALVFKTEPGQTSVVLKMLNNGNGGCGNDVAIDDIVFKSCGDFLSITDELGENLVAECEDEGIIVSTTITATPDFSIFNSHAYQWQESSDGTTWVDILGETSNTYTTPTLVDSRFFRVKVAEDPINISNPLCNVVSEVFSAIIVPIPNPPVGNGDVFVCENIINPLTVSVPADQIVNWYDAPTGGNLLLENSTSFSPDVSGTYYAAASSNLTDCFSPTRTALNYTLFELPIVTDENLPLCENVPIILSAGISNVTYRWSTGETTENIEIVEPGEYTMTATNMNGCSSTKTINVEQIDQPILDKIISKNEDIIVSTTNSGQFEYALDNGAFQDSPVFNLVQGGLYTISVRGKNNCPPVTEEFLHFVVPKFFSPNGDTFNDTFVLQGLEFFTNVEVQIFNRHGMLLKQSSSTSFAWDGTFNGQTLPSSDYWYSIKTDGQEYKGHFTLKR